MTLQTFVSIAGWLAALLILGAYGLLSFGKIRPSSWVIKLPDGINCGWLSTQSNAVISVRSSFICTCLDGHKNKKPDG